MRPVLIVTKDMAEFNTFHSVAKDLSNLGVVVPIVAEGLSLDKWLAAGFEVYGGRPEEGKFDPKTGMRYDIDARKVLYELRPRVVMAGLGNPINQGEKFAYAVSLHNSGSEQAERIVLGCVEDVWGVYPRISVVPDFICTPDTWESDRIKDDFKYGSAKTLATGNPSSDALLTLLPNPRLQKIASNYKLVVLCAGQAGNATTVMLRGLVEALNQVGDFLLLVRLHPKLIQSEDGVEWRKAAFEAKNGDVLLTGGDITGEHAMLSSHVVVSIFSNMIRDAALLGKIAVSWNGPEGQALMAKELNGLTHLPLAEYGAAVEVETAADFLAKVPKFGSSKHMQMREIAHQELRSGGTTQAVVDMICSYL